MCVIDGRVFKPCAKRRAHVNPVTTSLAEAPAKNEMIVDAQSAPSRKPQHPRRRSVRVKPKNPPTKKGRERLERRAQASKPEKLLCRYCGSDDLAPSFIKRRDARCRACFKKRYGSSALGKTKKTAGAHKSKRGEGVQGAEANRYYHFTLRLLATLWPMEREP